MPFQTTLFPASMAAHSSILFSSPATSSAFIRNTLNARPLRPLLLANIGQSCGPRTIHLRTRGTNSNIFNPRRPRRRKMSSKAADSSPEANPEAAASPPPAPPASASAARTLVSRLAYPWHLYSRSQSRRPYATQFYTSLVIYGAGDMCAQYFSGGDHEYNPYRTLRMVIIGGLASSPSYAWFLWLGRQFNTFSLPLSLASKVAVQQFVFAPVFNTYFFTSQAVLEGRNPAEVWERLQKTVPQSLVNSVKLWPAVTALNFWLVQPRWRMVVAGLVAVGWQSYLSWLNQAVANEQLEERLELEEEIKEIEKEKEVKEENGVPVSCGVAL